MPFDDINNIRRKIAEIDVEVEQLDIRRTKLYASRRFLMEQLATAETRSFLELVARINSLAGEVDDIKTQVDTMQREKKISGHFAVLRRIVDAILHTRTFTTAREWARVADVSYGSIYNNMPEVEKLIAHKGLRLIKEKTKSGTIFRVL
jgi:hypothetical protein